MKILRRISEIFILLTSIVHFFITGKTHRWGYYSFRNLHSTFNFKVNRFLDFLLSRSRRNTFDFSAESVVSAQYVPEYLSEMQRNGCSIFKEKLPRKDLDALKNFIMDQACYAENDILKGTNPQYLRNGQFKDPRLIFREDELTTNPVIQKLIADPQILRLAADYLQCEPMYDYVTAWWTTGANKVPDSLAAQVFHFDFDRPSFVKFFIYLTDVGLDNGPHVFVPTSHRNRTKAFRQDRRYTDEEVDKVYPKNNWKFITGESGTIFMADTVAMHKGTLPTGDGRLIVQIEYCSNFFGAPHDKISIKKGDVSPFLDRALKKYPYLYQKLTIV